MSGKTPDGANEGHISIIVNGVAGWPQINAFSVELISDAGPNLWEIVRKGAGEVYANGPVEDWFPIWFD